MVEFLPTGTALCAAATTPCTDTCWCFDVDDVSVPGMAICDTTTFCCWRETTLIPEPAVIKQHMIIG